MTKKLLPSETVSNQGFDGNRLIFPSNTYFVSNMQAGPVRTEPYFIRYVVNQRATEHNNETSNCTGKYRYSIKLFKFKNRKWTNSNQLKEMSHQTAKAAISCTDGLSIIPR